MRSCVVALLLWLPAPAPRDAPRPGGKKPALDQYGDPLPEGAVARVGTSRLRHGQMVIGIAYAPDGKTVATGGWDNLVRVWDVATGRQVRQFEGHKKPVYG